MGGHEISSEAFICSIIYCKGWRDLPKSSSQASIKPSHPLVSYYGSDSVIDALIVMICCLGCETCTHQIQRIRLQAKAGK